MSLTYIPLETKSKKIKLPEYFELIYLSKKGVWFLQFEYGKYLHSSVCFQSCETKKSNLNLNLAVFEIVSVKKILEKHMSY